MSTAFTGEGFDGMKFEIYKTKATANRWANQAWMLSAILGLAAASYGLTKLLAYGLY